MERKSLLKKKVQRLVKYLAEDKTENMELLSQFMKMKNRILRCFWLLFLACIFSTCVYQIWDRISYYMSQPTIVDVYNQHLHLGDLPATKLCTGGREQIEKLEKIKFNITALEFWKMVNTTDIIKTAVYTTENKPLFNASLTTKLSAYGTCTDVFNGNSLPLDDSTLRLRIELKHKLYVLRQCIELKGVDFIDMSQRCKNEALHRLQEQKVLIEKFIFLDKKQEPCLTPTDFDKCRVKCERQFYAANHTTCRYPFMDQNEDVPECWVSKNDLAKTLILAQNFRKGLKSCNCYRPCTTTMLYPYNDYIENNVTELHVLLQSNVIRVMKENLAYDFISLLCDIGGNLSLYLGVSCLTFTEVITNCVSSYNYRRKIGGLSKYKFFQLVSKIYKKECRKRNNSMDDPIVWSSESDVNIIKMAKLRKCVTTLVKIVKLIAFGLLLFKINEKISYYFTYPTTVTADLIESESQQDVSIVVCLASNEILEELKKFAEEKNIAVDEVDLVDLLHEPSDFSNADELWVAQSSIHEISEYMGGNKLQPFPPVKPLSTLFGNCTLHPFPFLFFNTTVDDCKFKVFPYFINDEIDLKRYMILHCGFLYLVRYGRQLLSRVNTPVSPCMSEAESNKCTEECYQRKFNEKIVDCSLPFTKMRNLRSCDTWKSAKSTQTAYIRAYLNTNPIRDCSCQRKCDEKILSTRIVTHNPTATMQTIAQFRAGNEYVEVIKHKLSFPIIKFFCDVGSILGILLGMSLMSILQIIESGIELFIAIKRKITQK